MTTERDNPHLIAYCTCPQDKADEIAHVLVQRRTCACVNVIPKLRSFYEWKGNVEQDDEALLVIKTRADRFAALEEAVREIHPYEVFELVASPVERGNAAYLRWLDESLGTEP